jgi:hypothetical protein
MKIKFVKPFRSKSSNQLIKSQFTKDGRFAKTLPPVRTVGDLKSLLSQLPDSLPLNLVDSGEDLEYSENGYKPVWFNIGDATENLQFEDNEGCWE